MSYPLMEDFKGKKRLRDEGVDPAGSVVVDSPEVKRLREDLLDSLEDDEDEAQFCTGGSDLDSFMKSFEKEITSDSGDAVEVVDLVSGSEESRPELGYLLEASDDDLGLPPTESSVQKSELGPDFWGFEPGMPGYDSDGYGFAQTENFNGVDSEYVAIDGLFDYSDMGVGSGDFLRRPERMPAQ
ncbi:hypothetical protein F511_11213 [Dorcoceras hygrometricum]|uniref:Uncharacterized protein n=1 Tax=Dorcoceras hygrometricum TaxID=472368 RepID=A0A2Z7D3Y5_9LAMI|nr:hypothetical protein F511_11213 [Dorcoceras hygrometricum]